MPAHSIRTTLAVAAVALAGIVSSVAVAGSAGADTTTAQTSTTWLSGVATGTIPAFEHWLGAPVGLDSTWAATDTWSDMTNVGWLPTPSQFPGKLAIGMAMLPTSDSSATFADCAAGDYDHYYAQMGSTLQSMGEGAAFVRLGWEMNGDWFRWSIANAKPATWDACWDHEVTALRSTDPDAQIVWNGNAQSSPELAGTAKSYYPGNDFVDVIGVDYYDQWPALDDQSAWDAQYDATESDGMPAGLGSWLAFAENHGKQLAVPEWGTDVGQGGGGDDPYYISAMHRFFATNASHIAYEAYFDTESGHEISGWSATTEVPKAAAEYRTLWGPDSSSVSDPTPPVTGTGTGSGTGSGTSGTARARHHGGVSRLFRLAHRSAASRRHSLRLRQHRSGRARRLHLGHRRTPRRRSTERLHRLHQLRHREQRHRELRRRDQRRREQRRELARRVRA